MDKQAESELAALHARAIDDIARGAGELAEFCCDHEACLEVSWRVWERLRNEMSSLGAPHDPPGVVPAEADANSDK